ncbi:hypothetical protein O6H91_Y337400 [Diphasiastrum complanatum]|nr:hypothetical protein O6H91_Y337400 [Diphasiastrum complanatum]
MADEKPVILITSGTSKTGCEVAKQLLATGNYTVRVGSRDPGKLSPLAARGAEAVLLDSTPSTASAAFTGVDAAYVVLPSIVGGVERVLLDNFLSAAKQTGVKHIVYLSAIEPKDSTVHQHHHYEQLLIESGLPFTILRPTFFHENVIKHHAASINKDGVFRTSAGDGVYTSVAVQDVAAVAVAALADPVKHRDHIYTLTTEAVTERQLAEKLSRALGKQVTHVNLTPEEHLELLTQNCAGTQSATFAAAMVDLNKKKRESRKCRRSSAGAGARSQGDLIGAILYR